MIYVYESQAWEYKILVKDVANEELISAQELNELGLQGWELAAIAALPDKVQFYFKRPRK